MLLILQKEKHYRDLLQELGLAIWLNQDLAVHIKLLFLTMLVLNLSSTEKKQLEAQQKIDGILFFKKAEH